METFKVKCGEILKADTDVECSNSIGQKVDIHEGEKFIIGFDSMIHCLKQRVVILPDDTFEISGYSAQGLSKFLVAWLDRSLDLGKQLETSENTLDDIEACIETALVEIGMEVGNGENTGN